MAENNVDLRRRRFLTAATSVVGAVGAAYLAVPFIGSWRPSAKTQAAGAPVEVDISKLELGQAITIMWRGRAVYVVRRSKDTVEKLASLDDQLVDPMSDLQATEGVYQQPSYAKNTYRSINPEYLVLVGLCTHLGCVPMYKPEVTTDWQGGFFCPCHGSKFDLAGRVYKSVPAQLNLVVPPYSYTTNKILVIGVDQNSAGAA